MLNFNSFQSFLSNSRKQLKLFFEILLLYTFTSRDSRDLNVDKTDLLVTVWNLEIELQSWIMKCSNKFTLSVNDEFVKVIQTKKNFNSLTNLLYSANIKIVYCKNLQISIKQLQCGCKYNLGITKYVNTV